jgi:hypothetical protein
VCSYKACRDLSEHERSVEKHQTQLMLLKIVGLIPSIFEAALLGALFIDVPPFAFCKVNKITFENFSFDN